MRLRTVVALCAGLRLNPDGGGRASDPVELEWSAAEEEAFWAGAVREAWWVDDSGDDAWWAEHRDEVMPAILGTVDRLPGQPAGDLFNRFDLGT